MTDLCAVTIFRFFGRNQLIFATNAVYSEGGAATGYYRRHGNAIAQASDVVKSQCPTNIAFTPVERLAQMESRLQALLQAVNIVSPVLSRSYDSLTAEQKARFNAMGAPEGDQAAQDQQSTNAATPQSTCGGNVPA